ncbi:hypothetical protein CS542_06985 [Pedobacter sp. IW39]|nr:hypothetical protein CS542_06985 [Pedobacter sp. IW39]
MPASIFLAMPYISVLNSCGFSKSGEALGLICPLELINPIWNPNQKSYLHRQYYICGHKMFLPPLVYQWNRIIRISNVVIWF